MSPAAIGNLESEIKRSVAPTEPLHAGLLRQHGFTNVSVENVRERNSKKELFEFVMSGKLVG